MFTPNTDAATGRVDLAFVRTGDKVGASGSGLLAALQFDAVGAGTSQLTISGVLANPTGGTIPLSSFPRRLSYDRDVDWLSREQRASAGYTFVEIAIVTAIVGILASAALPLARVTMQRNREIELRRSLREIRTAIDKYKDAADQNLISPNDIDNDAEGYPPTLETLVDGVTPANDTTGRKLRFLRRIPYDPMTRSTDWGLRSSRDTARREIVGRTERLRCLYEVRRQGARWDELS